MMANLMADSGYNKGKLTNIVEAICRNFRQHDDAELQKIVCWQKQAKSRSANKESSIFASSYRDNADTHHESLKIAGACHHL